MDKDEDQAMVVKSTSPFSGSKAEFSSGGEKIGFRLTDPDLTGH